jgi:hypothetical protein
MADAITKADEVARIGALSNGSNGQRSLESASLHFESQWRASEPPAEIRNESKDLPPSRISGLRRAGSPNANS